MADFDWKKLVAGIAPVLGTALGGPLAGQAITMLGQALGLGDKATEAEVAGVMVGGGLTGDQVVAMRQAEIAFQTRMKELDIDIQKLNADTEQAYLKDVQDARARQVATKDTMPQQILYVLLCVYVLEVVLFYFGKMPEDEFVRALMTRAFATVELGLSSAIAYFIGSSRGSKQSGDAVRKIAEQAGAK